jgi:cytochrome c2
MKKFIKTLSTAAIAATALSAASITATKVDGDLNKVSFDSKVWDGVQAQEIVLYPQSTIKMNDKTANELNADNGAKKALVKAVYNDKDISFLVTWPDKTMNVQTGYKTTSYADGFAVQVASDASNPDKLPYIGMGSDGRSVAVYLQKAVQGFFEPNGFGNVFYQINRNQTPFFDDELKAFDNKVKSIGRNDYERAFVSEGFRSMTEIKDATKSNSSQRLGYKDEHWNGALTRPLNDPYADLSNGKVAVAFAIWDGAKLGRDGIKNLTSWVAVTLDGKGEDKALVAVTDEVAKGDVEAGKAAIVANGCTGCHQISSSDPVNYMAPALMNIGGYSTAAYLRESLKEPSAVVVPGYNRNAHKNYMWYMVGEDGKRTSTMPSYSWLDEKSMNDIIAYLQSLKAEVK